MNFKIAFSLFSFVFFVSCKDFLAPKDADNNILIEAVKILAKKPAVLLEGNSIDLAHLIPKRFSTHAKIQAEESGIEIKSEPAVNYINENVEDQLGFIVHFEADVNFVEPEPTMEGEELFCNVPEVREIEQPDGSILLEPIEPEPITEGEELFCNVPEVREIEQPDGSILLEPIESEPITEGEELFCNVPEVREIEQPDGSILLEPIEPEPIMEGEHHGEGVDSDSHKSIKPEDLIVYQHHSQVSGEDGPIPELEAVIQSDGSTLYEEVKPNSDKKEELSMVPVDKLV